MPDLFSDSFPVVFFDFDDTLSEQIPFNLQYVRGIGAALSTLYGGDTEEWAAHAADMMVALEADYVARFRHNPLNGYCDWLPGMLAQAANRLFTGMNLAVPQEAAEVAYRMRERALTGCATLFPGASEAVLALHARGVPLHMASGNDAAHLSAALRGAGLDACFGRLYGPDLIDCAKEGPEFYTRLLAAEGLAPHQALFIDNDPAAIGWARAAGAEAIQVKLLPQHKVETAEGVRAVVTDLRQLPDMILPRR
jgi:FMN phosphatase YigB (HAD superfamily)